MSHSRETETGLLKIIVLFFIVFAANGKKLKKPLQEHYDDSEDFDTDVFCKKVSRLIRMEKADEIFVVDAKPNDSVLLQCKYCEEKDNSLPKTWSTQRHLFTGNITEVELDMDNDPSSSSIFMTKSHSLVIRNIQKKHFGFYFCKPPYIDSPEKSFNYLLDLIIEESGNVKSGNMNNLKDFIESYLLPVNEILGNRIYRIRDLHINVQVFTDWSDWSECDSCLRKEGIKNRMGRCRVKPICREGKECATNRKHLKTFEFSDKQNSEGPGINTEKEIMSPQVVRENIMIFALPLSCRSLLLKRLTPVLYKMTSKIPDFMLTEKCSDPCRRPNKKNPRYKKSIILAKGAHLTLVCPDSTTDSHVIWEHNRKRLYPNEGADYTDDEPRQYVDSYNTLYLFEVTDAESGNYTCFVNGVRIQEVTVIVLTRSTFFTKEFTRHLKNLGLMFMLCFFIYLIGVIVMCIETQSKRRNIKRKQKIAEDKKRLLGSSEGSGSDN